MITNSVIAGDYVGKTLWASISKNCLYIKTGFRKKLYINYDTVDHYELVDEKYHSKSSVGKTLVGGAFFGAAGALAGAASTKTKGQHKVGIYFKSGEKCLVDIDDNVYKLLVQACF